MKIILTPNVLIPKPIIITQGGDDRVGPGLVPRAYFCSRKCHFDDDSFFFPKSCEQGEGEELLTLSFMQEEVGAAPGTPPGPFLQHSLPKVP